MKNPVTYKAPQSIPATCRVNLWGYLIRRQNGYCSIAGAKGESAKPTELHHARIHNTKVNRSLYPLVVHSLLNLQAVNHLWHMKHGSFGAERGRLWPERVQRFLAKPHHHQLARWVNGF